MQKNVKDLTQRLLNSIDPNYNVTNMPVVIEVISALEKIPITEDLLKTTRLGKYINELRRKTNNVNLAKQAKGLLKKWRGLLFPEKQPQTNGVIQARTSPKSPVIAKGTSPSGSGAQTNGSKVNVLPTKHPTQPPIIRTPVTPPNARAASASKLATPSKLTAVYAVSPKKPLVASSSATSEQSSAISINRISVNSNISPKSFNSNKIVNRKRPFLEMTNSDTSDAPSVSTKKVKVNGRYPSSGSLSVPDDSNDRIYDISPDTSNDVNSNSFSNVAKKYTISNDVVIINSDSNSGEDRVPPITKVLDKNLTFAGRNLKSLAEIPTDITITPVLAPVAETPFTAPRPLNAIQTSPNKNSIIEPVRVTEIKDVVEVAQPKKRGRKKGSKNQKFLIQAEDSFTHKLAVPINSKVKTTKELLASIQSQSNPATSLLALTSQSLKTEPASTNHEIKTEKNSVVATSYVDDDISRHSFKDDNETKSGKSKSKKTSSKSKTDDRHEQPTESEAQSKSQSVEEILSQLPDIDVVALENELTRIENEPPCTCAFIEKTVESEIKVEIQPSTSTAQSIFDVPDSGEVPPDNVMKSVTYEFEEDTNCPAKGNLADAYSLVTSVADIPEQRIEILHTQFQDKVNSNHCEKLGVRNIFHSEPEQIAFNTPLAFSSSYPTYNSPNCPRATTTATTSLYSSIVPSYVNGDLIRKDLKLSSIDYIRSKSLLPYPKLTAICPKINGRAVASTTRHRRWKKLCCDCSVKNFYVSPAFSQQSSSVQSVQKNARSSLTNHDDVDSLLLNANVVNIDSEPRNHYSGVDFSANHSAVPLDELVPHHSMFRIESYYNYLKERNRVKNAPVDNLSAATTMNTADSPQCDIANIKDVEDELKEMTTAEEMDEENADVDALSFDDTQLSSQFCRNSQPTNQNQSKLISAFNDQSNCNCACHREVDELIEDDKQEQDVKGDDLDISSQNDYELTNTQRELIQDNFDSFREFHETVTVKSYEEDHLHILPYVVLE